MILNRAKTAYDVAQILALGGHKGKPHNLWSCPVANYLRKQYPTATDVSVSKTYGEIWWHRESLRIPLSPAVQEFIHNFDRWEYPELVG